MSQLVINLDFIPTNINGDPIDNETCAKRIGTLLLTTTSMDKAYEKGKWGRELLQSGTATFNLPDDQPIVDYFQNFVPSNPTFLRINIFVNNQLYLEDKAYLQLSRL